jgi:beta-galactosidase GanA
MAPMPPTGEATATAPSLRHGTGFAELHVEGTRYLVRGAEVHNSAASTPEAARSSFAAVAAVGANTVLAPVPWDAFEPAEGQYDVAVVDQLVDAARAAGLRLVVLWFGAYKNGVSSYAPAWVKTDPARFPRCLDDTGTPTATLSPFCVATREADARAFAAMVARIEQVDAADRTVLMVQVENEIGLLGCSRDHAPHAEQLFAGPPPADVLQAAGLNAPHPDWSSAFGDGLEADEHFMTWGFATYVDAVAGRGRGHTQLPFFTNAWLDSEIDLPGFALAGGQQAGSYPSGGPVSAMLPLWRALAPHLDLIVPDIYFGDFSSICSAYAAASGGLFIPEMRRDAQGVGDGFVAIGSHRAIGMSPFGVDSITEQEAVDLRDGYELLASVEGDLDSDRARCGFHIPATARPEMSTVLDFGDIQLRVTRVVPFGDVTPPSQGAFGVVVRLSPTRFLAVGRGFNLTFHDAVSARLVGLLSVLEHPRAPLPGVGERPVLRRLNGDETASGTAWIHPAREQRQSEVFPIPMSVTHTGVSSCEIYWLR